MDIAAIIFLMTGYVLLGIAMLRKSAFGERLGGLTIVLALAALVGVYLLRVGSTLYALLGLFAFIVGSSAPRMESLQFFKDDVT